MLGIVLVALGVAAAAYLVLKRFYAPMALLMVGAALIVVMGFVTVNRSSPANPPPTPSPSTSFR